MPQIPDRPDDQHPTQPAATDPQATEPHPGPQRAAAAPTWEQPVHLDPASAPDAAYESADPTVPSAASAGRRAEQGAPSVGTVRSAAPAPAASVHVAAPGPAGSVPQGMAPMAGQGRPAWQGVPLATGDPYGAGSAVTADQRAAPRRAPLSRGFLAGLVTVCLVIVLGVGVGGWAAASHFVKAEEVPPDGSHAHPYPLGGEPVTVKTGSGTASIALGTPNWNAWTVLREASRSTDEAPEGQVYVLVPVTVTNTGAGRITAGSVADIEYQTESGEEFPQKWVTTPRPAGYGEMSENMSQEFDLAFLVPAEDVEAGRFRITGAIDEEVWWLRQP